MSGQRDDAPIEPREVFWGVVGVLGFLAIVGWLVLVGSAVLS